MDKRGVMMGGKSLKSKLKDHAPAWLNVTYKNARIAVEFVHDYLDYTASTGDLRRAFSCDSRKDVRELFQSRLTLLSHALEKGMTLPKPRRPFGIARIKDIHTLKSEAESLGVALDDVDASEVLEAVMHFNETGEISDHVAPVSNWDGKALDKQTVTQFLDTRHSVRNFDPTIPVPREVIEEVIRLAGRTPSVCNRRAYKAHYYSDPDQIRRLLSLQNGNRGFGSSVPGLLVVTEKRSAFRGPGERNQRWIDGGLFAMSIVWILHAWGLGSCFLNWSETHKKTRMLRGEAGIPSTEDVIVLIAVGHPAEKHRIAFSPERKISEIFKAH